MYKLFIIEDDTGIAEAIKTNAEGWNFEVLIAKNFRNITEEFLQFKPHIVLLDISLPFFNGYYWCEELRKISTVPIIFISSASDNLNMVMAMNMGADDFLAKPFDQNLLMAKLQALLRRTYNFSGSANVIEHKSALLNISENTLTFNNKKIPLSKNEFKILHTLLQNKGKIVTREKLMETLWETDNFVDENTLSVNVGRLRKHLDSAGLTNFITTKFGTGYIIEN